MLPRTRSAAHSRALRFALLALLGAGACVPLPGWRPALRGRLLDARDGSPIAGVTIRTRYHYTVAGDHGGQAVDGPSAVTHADGAFFMAGSPRLVLLSPFTYTTLRPQFFAEHPFDVDYRPMSRRGTWIAQVEYHGLQRVELSLDPYERWSERHP
jgi:hypothetical protein